ncbi:hypothetical protein LAV73_08880 [Lysinibacillus xylanilyticus]|uniref:hypothetical protein n=1 Tax=Lysinibacillus xylanilyticus TaxID=582475 RepID=UPI002B249EB7|nr:hypothetical protein [Lysinibacillus xylanilyticus]MEB2280108.1 hypothetical protein [Lysinibacillus xylanilyticus]
MREIRDALWLAIKDKIINKTWFKVVTVLIILIVGFCLYKAYFSPNITKGEIGNENVWKEFDSFAASFKTKSKTLDGVETVENSDFAFDDSKLETVINTFFYTANTGNADLFLSTINPEQIDDDFSSFLLNERFNKIDDAMNRISRNGQLDKVNVVRSFWVLESKALRVVLDVYYKDLEKPIRMNMIIKKIEQEHSHSNEKEKEEIDIPFVSSSVWDIIEMIEDK